MNAWTFLRTLGPFASRERPGTLATASELKRWLQQKAVHANGESLAWDDPLDFPLHTLVLFPNNPRNRTTLW